MTPPPKGSRRRNGSLSVTCERLDSRLRVGSAVTGWVGTPRRRPFEQFTVEVTSTEVVGGKLVLGLGSVGMRAPPSGASVVLMPQRRHLSRCALGGAGTGGSTEVGGPAFDGADTRPFPA